MTPSRPPNSKPPFTLKDLREAIPPHCFRRSSFTSLCKVAQNVVPCLLLPYLVIRYMNHFPVHFQLIIWPLYWFLQGSSMFGIWALGHECGHHALFDSPLLNDVVGFVLHSSLLNPYYNFRISHNQHHQNIGNVDHDTLYVPPCRSSIRHSKTVQMLEESPLYNGLTLLLMLTMGLLPGYFLVNLGGPAKYGTSNHFSTSSPFFQPKQRGQIILGNCGFLIVLFTILTTSFEVGFSKLFFMYGVPYLVLNVYLITTSFLEHTDVFIPHLRNPEWTWLHGALCTVDRSFGSLLDQFFHQTSNTHVIHHLFPSIPSYHAVEATNAVVKLLGPYYLRDETPLFKALWRASMNCRFVEDHDPIVYYKRKLTD